jgi:hypothetical protein
MQNYCIQYKGKLHVFKRSSDDSPDKLEKERYWFIARHLEKNDYDHVVNMSHIWANNKFYNLQYEPHIMATLKELTDSVAHG